MITAHDLFAGAGGSSTGLHTVPGIQVVTAANHWKLAVEVHNRNHPNTDHVCADISQIDPRYFPRAELLWASPECTNHSVAKGKKRELGPDLFGETLPDEAAERSRATMWDVVRFAEHHAYRAVIVENVVDAYNWVPFRAWLMAMDSLGYDHRIVYLNSMHAQYGGLPAPQSRDRMYVVFWRKGARRPELDRMQRPKAWCPSCDQVVESVQTWKRPDGPWGRCRAQYYYRCPKHSCKGQRVEPAWLPAAVAIDWSLEGQRIGDRTRPLAAKTRARIAAGIARYWKPLLVPVEGRDGKDARPLDEPMRTMTTRNESGIAIPFLTLLRSDRARNTDPAVDPLATIVADGSNHGLITGEITPFIAELRGGSSDARTVTDPMATVTASGNHHGLVMPYYGASEAAKHAGDPLGALTTRDRYALITPAGGSWNHEARAVSEPHRALTTREAYGLVMRNNSSKGDGAEMTTPAREPLRTLTTAGHQSLIESGREVTASDVDDCLFRMFEPHEVAAGMAFPADYIWEGTRRAKVRMAGNAVTPPASRDLGMVVAEALQG